MKKTLNNRKIQLHRETVRQLDAAMMANAAGGQPVTTATNGSCCIPNTAAKGSTCYVGCSA